ncbi:MAG: M23 family metallopeptidase [Clostridia bacterium]|nr:M23 family metallopeptidase [Clostridia bacterium]
MGRRDFYQEEKMKKTIYVFGITLILSIVIFLTIFVMYNRKLKEEASLNLDNLGALEDIVENDDLEETSSSSDLSLKNAIKEKSATTVNTTTKKVPKNEPVSSVVEKNTNKVSNKTNTNVVQNTTAVTEEKQLEFSAPVAGEIIKDFATDSLIYSKTLEEWTTHSGIDIKAEKMTIVTASEAGTIESIKNDPRYGLTITINHEDGFKTIYSNLLSTEFVKEGEEVEKGQTIGTVGESASFEVAEEAHLHFEMYKDGALVNPTIYLK